MAMGFQPEIPTLVWLNISHIRYYENILMAEDSIMTGGSGFMGWLEYLQQKNRQIFWSKQTLVPEWVVVHSL
jgi:hypothetical protein